MKTMPSPHPASKNWLLYTALIVVTAIGPLALNIFMPSIPGLVTDLSTTSGMAQLTLTLYLAGTAVSQLIYGPLSDRFGRRPVLLAGILVFIMASILCAYSTSIEMLIAARLIQSFGGAAGMVLTRAIIRDMHDEKSGASVLGYVTMAWATAPMVAPALGGYLDQVAGWRASFWALTIFGVVALVLAIAFLPETNQTKGQASGESRLAGYRRLLGNNQFLWLSATLAFTSGIFFSFLGGAPFIMITVLNQSPLDYGIWFAVVAVGYITGNFISGRFSKTTATGKMITTGIVIATLATLIPFAAGLSDNLTPALFFIPMGLIALGNGITLPNATSAALSSDARAIGSAAGLAGFIQSTAGALAAQSVGVLQASVPLIAIWFMMAGAILSAGAYMMVARKF
ncbi:MAG TPA: Bcr/CflA family efflux MFS transporter [Rhizobiales bacterium]|nr:Bcr/CflA family efflux MFS transporter [Hyphomicrobiales bacterium]